MFSRFVPAKRSHIGLDIGSSRIKTVALERRGDRLSLARAGVAETPAGVFASGEPTDGIAISQALKALWSRSRITGKRVSVGVGGDRVYCQADPISADSEGEIEQSVRRRALQVSGLPPDAVVLGSQSVDAMIEDAVLWAACGVRQIDWLRETVSLAGKSLEWITPQAFGLGNVYSHSYQPAAHETALLLNFGARRLTLVVMRGWAVAYARDVSIGRNWDSAPGAGRDRLLATLDYYWEEIERRARPHGLSRVLLSGGPARRPELVDAMLEHTGVHVSELEPFRRIAAGGEAKDAVEEHRSSLAVAVGLALTSCEDL